MSKILDKLKVNNVVYEIEDRAAREHLIEVNPEQPTSEANKLWIKNQETEYEIPTMDEFNILNDKVTVLWDSKIDIDVDDEKLTFKK